MYTQLLARHIGYNTHNGQRQMSEEYLNYD